MHPLSPQQFQVKNGRLVISYQDTDRADETLKGSEMVVFLAKYLEALEQDSAILSPDDPYYDIPFYDEQPFESPYEQASAILQYCAKIKSCAPCITLPNVCPLCLQVRVLNVDQLFVSYKDPDRDDEILEGKDMAVFLVKYLEYHPQKQKKAASVFNSKAAGTLRKTLRKMKSSSVLSRRNTVLSNLQIESSPYKQARANYVWF